MQQITRTSAQIGAAVRRQRKRLRLSQGQVSEKTRHTQATISKLENGDDGSALGTLLNVLAALNLELVIRPRTKAKAADIEDIF